MGSTELRGVAALNKARQSYVNALRMVGIEDPEEWLSNVDWTPDSTDLKILHGLLSNYNGNQ